jgi:hypothetical protein
MRPAAGPEGRIPKSRSSRIGPTAFRPEPPSRLHHATAVVVLLRTYREFAARVSRACQPRVSAARVIGAPARLTPTRHVN